MSVGGAFDLCSSKNVRWAATRRMPGMHITRAPRGLAGPAVAQSGTHIFSAPQCAAG